MFWFLALCRFIVDLIDTISGRWQTSTDNENRLKQSVISLFVDSTKPPEEMEEFEFELLKAELLTQPMEKDGSQLFHRNTSWLRKVSEIKLPENRGDFVQHVFYGRLDSQFFMPLGANNRSSKYKSHNSCSCRYVPTCIRLITMTLPQTVGEISVDNILQDCYASIERNPKSTSHRATFFRSSL